MEQEKENYEGKKNKHNKLSYTKSLHHTATTVVLIKKIGVIGLLSTLLVAEELIVVMTSEPSMTTPKTGCLEGVQGSKKSRR